jgi:hypothetical protein
MNAHATPGAGAPDSRAFLGLVWNDWRRHRPGIVLGGAGIALMLLVIGGTAPDAIFLLLAIAMAVASGFGFGGSERALGEEEYAFALPPTRRERYLARLALAGSFLLGVYAVGVLTCYAGLSRLLLETVLSPQDIDRLAAETGEPFTPFHRALALAFPLALFAECFAVAMAPLRADGRRLIFEPLGVAVVCTLLVLVVERAPEGGLAWIAVPALLVLAAWRLRAAFVAYRGVEAAVEARPVATTSNRAIVALLFVLTGLALLGTLVLWFVQSTR